jgi:hypothetical protein
MAPEAVIEPDKTRVFIFDVFDHPGNTREWYEARKKKFKDDGLPHVFRARNRPQLFGVGRRNYYPARIRQRLYRRASIFANS